jgi:hypothetical protein
MSVCGSLMNRKINAKDRGHRSLALSSSELK